MTSTSGKGLAGKFYRLLPLMVIMALLLSACGAEPAAQPTATTAAVEQPTATTAAMEAPTATTAAMEAPTATTAASVDATATKPKPVASKEGTLTLWVHEGAVGAVEKVSADFTSKYNVQVSVQQVGFGDIRDQLKLAGPAGEGPDIIVGAHDWLGELVQNGLLDPIDLGAKGEMLDPVALQAFTYEGKVYGLPYGLEAIALMYNKDLVPTPPTTWAELKTIAKQLQDEKKVDQGYILQSGDPYHAYPIITGFGGYVFGRDAAGNYDPTNVGLDSVGGKAAFKEIDQMIKDGLLRKDITGAIQQSLFLEGKSAMWFAGPWTLNDIRKSGIKYGVAPIPSMTQKAQPFVGAQGFMVSQYGKNKDVAKAFLTEFLATDEAMQAMYDSDPRVPAWKSVQAKVFASTKPEDVDIKAFAQSAGNGVPMPAIPQMSAVWTSWTKAIDLVFTQAQDPEGAITDASKTIRDEIAKIK
ncbi:MAG: extracellular solute-binding protein [Chloroflexia bacterium]